jgi:fluoroquinolone resistance protein
MAYFFEQRFEQIIAKEKPLVKGEYEQCVFRNCDFNFSDWRGFKFIDCQFIDCNLSMANLSAAVMNVVHFQGCKLLGIQWFQCDKLSFIVSFKECQLANGSFYKTILKKARFENCDLTEVDFAEADCREVIFDCVNLSGAVFDNTNLSKANFTTAYNFNINPNRNRVKGAIFEVSNLSGLLSEYKLDIR